MQEDSGEMITFRDQDSGESAFVLVRRASQSAVGLTVSIEGGADIEVFAEVEVAIAIADALKTAAREEA
jgi:hypothetical protein